MAGTGTGVQARGAADPSARREAEEKLDAAFDQRTFHDAILALGSVPLPVLEERMTQFIAQQLEKRP